MGVKMFEAALAKTGPESSGTNFETVNAVNMLLKPPPPRQYLLDGLPLGVVGLIAGHGGVSKSTFVLDMALSVTAGMSVCDGLYSVKMQGEALIVAGEDDGEEIHRRVHAIGQKKFASDDQPKALKEKVGQRLHVVSLFGKSAALLDGDEKPSELFEELLTTAKSIDRLRLVVIDPLRRFYDGEENDSGAATQIVMLLEQIAKETGATVLAVHHMNKSSGRSPDSYAARGSSAFTDGVRWQLNMGRISDKTAKNMGVMDDDRYWYVELRVTKNNYAPPQDRIVILKRLDHGVLVHVDLNKHAETTMESLVSRVVDRIKELDKNEDTPTKNAFIQNHKGIDGPFDVIEKQLREAVDKAIQKGLVKLVPHANHKGPGKKPGLLKPA